MATPKLLGIIFNRIRYSKRGTISEKNIMKKYKVKILIVLSESAIDKKYQSKIHQVIEELYDALNHEQEINK